MDLSSTISAYERILADVGTDATMLLINSMLYNSGDTLLSFNLFCTVTISTDTLELYNETMASKITPY